MTIEQRAAVVVVGGGLGGVAAAWAAAESGQRVILIEETDWLGGQWTSQAVPPDEHPWIEQFGSTRRYRSVRDAIRAQFKTWYPLRAESRQLDALNPGAGKVSAICHEPGVAALVFRQALRSFESAGRLELLMNHRLTAAETGGDHITSITVQDQGSGVTRTLLADIYIDATETGDLLAFADVENVTGFEARSDTGESQAPATAQPMNMQAASWCFALEHHDGEDFTIDKPEGYEHWAAAQPHFWPGQQFGWDVPHPHTGRPRRHSFRPNPDDRPFDILADQSKDNGADELWTFRRILARNHFVSGAYTSDVTLVNWPMIDYLEGPLLGGTPEENARHRARTKEMSLAFVYWLQTAAPNHEGGTGYPGLRLATQALGTTDGFAKQPYIRESRRLIAETRITGQDVSIESRNTATSYEDSVGVGAYRIDLHPSTGGDNYIDVPAHPFEIPVGATIPVRVDNLLAGGKNIGTTHISNGCYRLHPVEWNIGEAVGTLAAHALELGVAPRAIRNTPRHLDSFQSRLSASGVELRWPRIEGW